MIPFQFHITVEDIDKEREDSFLALCRTHGVKPLLIRLNRGDFIHQPMFTALVEAESFADAKAEAEVPVAAFRAMGYAIARIKVEVPPEHAAVFATLPECGFAPYYEWHCKVRVVDLDGVRALCAAHSGHLSRNALDEDRCERYVTLREFGGETDFRRGIAALLQALEAGDVPVIKQKLEYCICDSRPALDGGWAV